MTSRIPWLNHLTELSIIALSFACQLEEMKINVFVINNSQKDADNYRDLHTCTTYIVYVCIHTYLYLPYTYIYAYLYTINVYLCARKKHMCRQTRGELNFQSASQRGHFTLSIQRCLTSAQGHHNSCDASLQTVTAFSFLF